MITAVKPPQTAINAISNVDSVSMLLLGSWPPLPGTLGRFETPCVLVTDAVGKAGEGVIIVVVAIVAIELVEYSTPGKDLTLVDPVGTEECTVVGRFAHDVAGGVQKTGSIK